MGHTFKLRQSKGKVRVVIPVGAPLKRTLDAAVKRSTIPFRPQLRETLGHPTAFALRGGKASRRRILGVTFNDLRGTAVTRLALAGCTETEIATITGHTLRDVRSILDAHYLHLHRDPALAESAIRKLERRTRNLPNELPNGPGGFSRRLEKSNNINGWGTRIRT